MPGTGSGSTGITFHSGKPAFPEEGDAFFNHNNHSLYCYTGGVWCLMSSSNTGDQVNTIGNKLKALDRMLESDKEFKDAFGQELLRVILEGEPRHET